MLTRGCDKLLKLLLILDPKIHQRVPKGKTIKNSRRKQQVRIVDSMKTYTKNNWRKREFLFTLYCVAFLHYLVPVAAAPSSRKQSPETTAHTNNDNKASQSNTNAQNQQINNPSISLTKRSIQMSLLPGDFSRDFQLLNQKDCEDDPSLCTGKFQSWDNQEYDSSNFSDGENDGNMFVYNDMEKYYEQPAEDINKISDKYTLSHRTVPKHESSLHIPKIIIMPLPKSSYDEIQDEISEDGNPPIRESKKNIFTSRGWGAGGMPFSVLYLHQQQHLKPARSPIAGTQQLVAPPAPLRGFPSQYRQVAVRNALSSALTSAKNVGGGAGTPLPTRRQYSIIPQLYVSYGWGPNGK